MDNKQNKQTLEDQTEELIKYTFSTGAELITTKDGQPVCARNQEDLFYSEFSFFVRMRQVIGSTPDKTCKKISDEPKTGEYLVMENLFALWNYKSAQPIERIDRISYKPAMELKSGFYFI